MVCVVDCDKKSLVEYGEWCYRQHMNEPKGKTKHPLDIKRDKGVGSTYSGASNSTASTEVAKNIQKGRALVFCSKPLAPASRAIVSH